MYRYLRIASCIICVLFLASVFFVGIWVGLWWAVGCLAGAVIFGLLTYFFKNKDEQGRLPERKHGDYLDNNKEDDKN